MKNLPIPLIGLCFLLFSSCANYQLNYHQEEISWQESTPPTEPPTHTIYLIGDAGNSMEGSVAPPVALLGTMLEDASENSSTIFLGDNIYHSGLPPEGAKTRKEAEHRINVQLDILKDYPGKPYFIAGNHDWAYDGLDAVKRQEEYIEDYLDNKEVWIPEDGCGGPVEVEVNEFLTIIFIDSEWYLTDWDKEPQINDGCENKSRQNFLFQLDEMMRKHRKKNVVIAMHHPLYSNGPHGGGYTAKQHLFPLTDIKDHLWIPLPGLGTLSVLYRTAFGMHSDLSYPAYRKMKGEILEIAKKYGSFLFVAGHEHNLQYIERDNQQFIVSGSGSKVSPAKLGGGARFAYGEGGIAILKFYEDCSGWLEFWATTKNAPEGKLVFRKNIREPLPLKEPSIGQVLPPFVFNKDSVSVTLWENTEPSGKFHNWLWGHLYRDVYKTPISAPVLNLNNFKDGLRPVRIGGGGQTNSLRLQAPDEKQYVMRDLNKDASRTVPFPLNETFAREVFTDIFASAHPLAAFLIPDMADAIHVLHTNPRLYFVPEQPALGYYNGLFGNTLYLLEERPDEDWREANFFANSKDIVSTHKVVEEITEDHDEMVDQQAVLRARLFDQILGDWDRHDDNWRWAETRTPNGLKIYKPIPRDRDQAFSSYESLLLPLIRGSIPYLKQLREYGPEIPNIRWVNYHGRHFDRTFLNKPDWTDYQREAQFIQENLTDQVIEDAVKLLPSNLYQMDGEELILTIKGRRDNLMKIARGFYEHLAQKVDVLGTEKKDWFEVQRLTDDKTLIQVFDTNGEGEKKEKIYERLFRTSETKEVTLYGLGNDDVFYIHGEVAKGIKIRVVGGLGEDAFIDESLVEGLGKKTIIHDNKEGNGVKIGRETKDLRSKRRAYNTYNRRGPHYEFNYSSILPIIGFQPDDGLFLGFNLDFIRYGYQKNPYAQKHRIGGFYAFATAGYKLNYLGEFTSILGKWNGLLKADFSGPLYTFNYFGLGNETDPAPDSENFDFNRVRRRFIGFYPGLRHGYKTQGGYCKLGLIGEAIRVESTEGRFIDAETPGVRPENFKNQIFGGAEIELGFKNLDVAFFPSSGIHLEANASWRANLQENERQLLTLQAFLSFYQGFFKEKPVVLATRLGTEHLIGAYEFFQAATLGGSDNLRGFRNERFAGQTSFYHNTDLRIRLLDHVNYYLPFKGGVYGGFDYGRVWLEDERSNTWHTSYGGGLWIAPLDLMAITAGLFFSDEGERLEVRTRFLF